MYLHSKGFAPGDLKLVSFRFHFMHACHMLSVLICSMLQENELLSLHEDAVLNDFGLTRHLEMAGNTTTALTHAGNFRWYVRPAMDSECCMSEYPFWSDLSKGSRQRLWKEGGSRLRATCMRSE